MFVAVVVDCDAIDVFHDEVGQAIVGRSAVEKASDVWMI